MKKEYDFKHILGRLKYWHGQDERINEGLEALTKAVAPNSYAPVSDISCVQAYMEQFDEDLNEWLGYWLYEAQSMKNPEITYKGKKWDFKKEAEVIDYLDSEFN